MSQHPPPIYSLQSLVCPNIPLPLTVFSPWFVPTSPSHLRSSVPGLSQYSPPTYSLQSLVCPNIPLPFTVFSPWLVPTFPSHLQSPVPGLSQHPLPIYSLQSLVCPNIPLLFTVFSPWFVPTFPSRLQSTVPGLSQHPPPAYSLQFLGCRNIPLPLTVYSPWFVPTFPSHLQSTAPGLSQHPPPTYSHNVHSPAGCRYIIHSTHTLLHALEPAGPVHRTAGLDASFLAAATDGSTVGTRPRRRPGLEPRASEIVTHAGLSCVKRRGHSATGRQPAGFEPLQGVPVFLHSACSHGARVGRSNCRWLVPCDSLCGQYRL